MARDKVSSSSAVMSPIETDTSRARLVSYFLIWKTALLLVAAASPGPGYDTSTQLFFGGHEASAIPSGILAKAFQHVAIRLTRWDAIYFVSASANGLIYEQQWAFSPAFASITSLLSRVFPPSICTATTCHALAGIILSHITHLLAVLVLHALVLAILASNPDKSQNNRIAFTTACLHIISPAGLFLSAAYGESTFAFLNFSGMLCYTLSSTTTTTSSRSYTYTLLAGLLFALATLIRSNGLFSGLIFLWDAISLFLSIKPSTLHHTIPRLALTILSGTLIAMGYLLPQYFAYLEFCPAETTTPSRGRRRSWCDNTLPSIYSFVQSEYWNVGLFRYWTLSNLPLFLLATPMLLLLTTTAVGCFTDEVEFLITGVTVPPSTSQHEKKNIVGKGGGGGEEKEERRKGAHPNHHHLRPQTLLRKFAIPQLLLATLALTTFHVQIINRISSGYPVWYLVLGMAIEEGRRGRRRRTTVEVQGRGVSVLDWCLGRSGATPTTTPTHVEWIVRVGVVYAVVQGGLFAGFMPPA